MDASKFKAASLEELDGYESLVLADFNADTAWKIGYTARIKAQELGITKPIVIDVTDVSGRVLFHSATGLGTTPDNDRWVERKRRTVFRFGKSSFYMGKKLESKGETSTERAFFVSSIDYATHGGSVPIRIRGYDGIVAALTISGMKQEEDHAFALKVLNLFA